MNMMVNRYISPDRGEQGIIYTVVSNTTSQRGKHGDIIQRLARYHQADSKPH